jgi:hypothetical protein
MIFSPMKNGVCGLWIFLQKGSHRGMVFGAYPNIHRPVKDLLNRGVLHNRDKFPGVIIPVALTLHFQMMQAPQYPVDTLQND